MTRFLLLLSLLVSCVALCAAETEPPAVNPAGDESSAPAADSSTPEGAVMLNVEAMRKADLSLLFDSMPASERDEMKEAWESFRAMPATPEQDAEFDTTLAMLRAEDAVDALMIMAEPKLADINPQAIAGYIGMAAMLLPAKIAEVKDPAQKQQLQQLLALIPPAQQWVLGAGLDDRDKARQAIEQVVAWAKDLPVASSAELRQLEFTEVVDLGDSTIALGKELLGIYEADVDGFLDSIEAESTAGETDDERTLTIAMSLFGKPLSFSMEMKREGEGWTLKNGDQMMQQALQGAMGGGGLAPAPAGDPLPPADDAAPF